MSLHRTNWNCSPSWLVCFEGRQLLGAVLRLSGESGELSKRLHDDSTINVVPAIGIKCSKYSTNNDDHDGDDAHVCVSALA